MIDPTLTMDWTTLNPPNVNEGDTGREFKNSSMEDKSGSNGPATEIAAEPVILYNDDDDDAANMASVATSSLQEDTEAAEERSSTGDNDAAGTIKEAISPPSKMDTEPERLHVNSTAPSSVGVDEEEETMSEATNNNTDSELDSVIAASKVESQGHETLGGPSTDTTNATTISGTTNTSSSPEVVEVPTITITPTDSVAEASSPPPSPTPSIISKMTTSSPTPIPTEDEYEESTDDSPLPAANEPPAKNIDDDRTYENDNVNDEEELPPTKTTEDWDTTTKDEMYKEEQEEVKKVGGWLSFVSVVLLVYTAYQMSENPDGICAR